MAGVNKAVLKNPGFFIKILCLCIDIIVLILARSGFNEEANYETAYQNADHRWLTIITTGGYILIFAALIVAAIIGDQAHVKLELMFMFTGCILFLACGSMAIEQHQPFSGGSRRDTGLAWGSLAIIIGIFMFLDCLLMGKALKTK